MAVSERLGLGTPLYTAAITNGTANQQTISCNYTPSGGTFTLTVNGEKTTALAYNASAATVVAALCALKCVGTTGCTGSGGALPGTPVVITFGTTSNGNLFGVTPVMTVDPSALTGGTPGTMAVAADTQASVLPTHRLAATGALCILNDGTNVKLYINTSQILGKPAWAVVGSQS